MRVLILCLPFFLILSLFFFCIQGREFFIGFNGMVAANSLNDAAADRKAYLMRKCPNRNAERPCQSKVSELQQVVAAVYEQVLRLEIPVEHAVRVAVGNAQQHLVEEGLQGDRAQSRALHYISQVRLTTRMRLN
jgi:hypothetical protein